ncbi:MULTISPECIES: hypothetical protein [Pseudomonas]|uniref:hypothetical protein n=1 Tax=Pseudomonas TaxID=286 RepID=UPI001FF1C1B0|nr:MULTISPECIES: hypothetical protein [Pseudomonas]
MKLDALTPQQEALLDLPVVFTIKAWNESVYIAKPLNIAEQGCRLTSARCGPSIQGCFRPKKLFRND